MYIRLMKLRRWLKWTVTILLVPPLIVIGIYLYPVIPDPESGFWQRKGELIRSEVTRQWQQGTEGYEELSLMSDSGLVVEISVRRPRQTNGPLPLMILLGGYGSGRHAVEILTESYPVIVAGVSYRYGGNLHMQGVDLLRNIRHIQQAQLDITPAILLALDYLLTRKDVDAKHVELVGVSLGAFFVAIPGAIDTRFTRVWFIQGAGDPRGLFEQRLEKRIASAWWRAKVAGLVALLLNEHHLAPELWVGRIAPRPVVAVNSRGDVAFTPHSVAVLHAAFGEPHEIIWIEGEHVRPTRHDVVQQLSEVVISRIASPPGQVK
jgi:hypothetical protein